MESKCQAGHSFDLQGVWGTACTREPAFPNEVLCLHNEAETSQKSGTMWSYLEVHLGSHPSLWGCRGSKMDPKIMLAGLGLGNFMLIPLPNLPSTSSLHFSLRKCTDNVWSTSRSPRLNRKTSYPLLSQHECSVLWIWRGKCCSLSSLMLESPSHLKVVVVPLQTEYETS